MSIIRFLAFALYRFKVTGKENIPEGAAIICGNHTAQHDPAFLIAAFGVKQRLVPMSKIELKTKPVLGWMLTKIGTIFVDRGKSDLNAIKQSMRMLKDGGKLIIFPEGTRVKDGEASDAKNGAAMLACRNNVPLVPVFITKGPKKLFSRVAVNIGKPQYVTCEGKPTGEFLDEQTKLLMQTIFALENPQ